MARGVIPATTMWLPEFGVGSRVKVSSGNFNASDVLALYMLKLHYHTKVCPSLAPVAEAAGAVAERAVSSGY
jgi:hypothetical protein